jgi:hypothetical protein
MRELLAQSLPVQGAESGLELVQVAESVLGQVAELALAQEQQKQLRSRLLTSEMP